MAKVKKEEYKLPNPLIYRLNNPNYTIYHRAALGGLASTIAAWGENQPEGIKAKVKRDEVRFSWNGDELSDQDFLRKLIVASFKLTKEKLIDLPGHRLDTAREDLRLAVHNGITATFLQHPKMRIGEKGSRRINLKTGDDDTGNFFTYKAIDIFAHQKAQKTGLLDEKSDGTLPPFGAIQQWTIPGVAGGSEEFLVSTEEAILLHFLMAGSVVFLLRPRTFKEKAQSCLVVPEVIDLLAFSKAIAFINSQNQDFRKFSNNYLNRVVGGAEEAGLRFLLDLQADDLVQSAYKSVSDCTVVAMGKVAWDKNQVNRSMIAKVRGDYDEINVFTAAKDNLGRSKVVKLENGDSFVVPSSPVPELIAANLANERHWCSNFVSLVSEKKDFQQMMYSIGGLQKMKEEIKDENDQIIIGVFHEAWNHLLGEFGERARKGEFIFEVKVENEREKMRNAILRTKTSDSLASWFLRFCADASKKAPLKTLQDNGLQIRKFIFNQRNFERFQNLCLFALISYASEKKSNENQTTGEN